MMTNREVLNTPKDLLSELDRQRQFLLQVEGAPVPCPACRRPLDLFTAAGIDIDQYDFGRTTLSYRCPDCGAPLEQVIPVFPGGRHLWHWELPSLWLQEQLAKARAHDQQQTRPQ
jgi:hypothetical protein